MNENELSEAGFLPHPQLLATFQDIESQPERIQNEPFELVSTSLNYSCNRGVNTLEVQPLVCQTTLKRAHQPYDPKLRNSILSAKRQLVNNQG